MLTKDDKKFLTENFAIKSDINAITEDIKLLATKKELVGMKADITEIKADIVELKVDSKLLQEAVIRLEQSVEEGVELSRKTLTTVENFAGNIATLDQENKFGAVILHRHGIQIHELATATGTAISE